MLFPVIPDSGMVRAMVAANTEGGNVMVSDSGESLARKIAWQKHNRFLRTVIFFFARSIVSVHASDKT